jgi:hypothetical protein
MSLEEVRCECGKVCKTKRALSCHKSRDCSRLERSKVYFICPFCKDEFKRSDNFNTHLRNCKQRPDESKNEKDTDKSKKPKNSKETKHETTTTTITNNITNTNNTNIQNNYNINYCANLTISEIEKAIASNFSPDYIKQGEEGLYDFILKELFTDPNNPDNKAIICKNYKQLRFLYNSKQDQEDKGSIKEDIALSNLNKLLSKFNGLIEEIIYTFHPVSIGCSGYNSEETNIKRDKLIQSLIDRKKFASSIANKIRYNNSDPLDFEFGEEQINDAIEYYRDRNMLGCQKYKMSEEEREKCLAYDRREASRNIPREIYERNKRKSGETVTYWNEITNQPEILDEQTSINKCLEEDQQWLEKQIRKDEIRKQKKEEKKIEKSKETSKCEIGDQNDKVKELEAVMKFKQERDEERKHRLEELRKEREEQEKKDIEEDRKMFGINTVIEYDDEMSYKSITKSKNVSKKKIEKIVKSIEKKSQYNVKKLEICSSIKETDEKESLSE